MRWRRIITGKESAIIVHLENAAENNEASLEELRLLVETAGGEVVAILQQKKEKPHPAYFLGKGKLEELLLAKEEKGVELVIFNQELSPTQVRNLEKVLGGKIIDRTALILDIFAKRALSREGKLQVELAQLSYLLPRLAGRGAHLSRLGGGIGTRGPGETQLEIDRRSIKRRIAALRNEIAQIKKHRQLHRHSRREKGFALVALVGYTNAGKSTLFNALTGSKHFTEDKLFATLDPASRKLLQKEGGRILLTDTVGFIRNLPPQLIDAFSATLEEVTEADLLLHVVDLSQPDFEEMIKTVTEILAQLAVGKKEQILVLNKTDLLSPAELARYWEKLSRKYPQSVFVSAVEKKGFAELFAVIKKNLGLNLTRVQAHIPLEQWPSYLFLYDKAMSIKVEYTPSHVLVEAMLDREQAARLSAFSEKPVTGNALPEEKRE